MLTLLLILFIIFKSPISENPTHMHHLLMLTIDKYVKCSGTCQICAFRSDEGKYMRCTTTVSVVNQDWNCQMVFLFQFPSNLACYYSCEMEVTGLITWFHSRLPYLPVLPSRVLKPYISWVFLVCHTPGTVVTCTTLESLSLTVISYPTTSPSRCLIRHRCR